MRTVTFTPKSANSFINVTVRAQAHIDPNFGTARYDGNMRLFIKLYQDGVVVADTRARNGSRNTGPTKGNWTTVAAAFYQTASAGLPIVWKVTAITDGGGTNQYEMQNFDLLIEEVTL
ncbi:MAG: hypothetical protein D6698_11450 [Gammaproteobacteria bacterium]|nr:MAG: hypothetical protein D6698_11450 [Gammaproteobacteria bacterium]